MTASGASWTRVLQANLEATAGAGGAATRMLTDVTAPAVLGSDYKRARQGSVRGSVHPQWNAPITNSQLETLKGLKIRGTYESLPWWLQLFIKGGVTGVMSDTSAYTYTFTPTSVPANGNDRKTAAFEIGDAVGYYTAAYGVGTKFGIKLYGNKPMEITADFECQKRTTLGSLTSLSPVAWEEINGSTFTAFLDATTLGSTAFAATEASLDIENKYEWLYTADGNLYPSSAVFTGYTAKLGMKVAFTSLTEWTAWNASTERKARLKVTSPTLAGAATAYKSLQIDWYGYWDDSPEPKESNGVYFVDLVGECHVDATATKPFEVAVTNALATLP